MSDVPADVSMLCFPGFPSYKPRYLVLLFTGANTWVVGGYFPHLNLASDFAQRGDYSNWRMYGVSLTQSTYLDCKAEYEARLYTFSS